MGSISKDDEIVRDKVVVMADLWRYSDPSTLVEQIFDVRGTRALDRTFRDLSDAAFAPDIRADFTNHNRPLHGREEKVPGKRKRGPAHRRQVVDLPGEQEQMRGTVSPLGAEAPAAGPDAAASSLPPAGARTSGGISKARRRTHLIMDREDLKQDPAKLEGINSFDI